MKKYSHRTQDLNKLLRLQRSRITTAEAAYTLSQAEYNKANMALQKRQARIDQLRKQRDTLMNYGFERDASELVRFFDCAYARRKWVDHDLERDEYWLTDDQRELNTAAKKVKEMRRQWLQLRAREASIERLLNDVQRNQRREVEKQTEIEATEFATTGLRNSL